MQTTNVTSPGVNYNKEVKSNPVIASTRASDIIDNSSAAINSADAFVIKLSELLKALREVKAGQKHIDAVISFIQTTLAYRARLSQIHWGAREEETGSKSTGVDVASSDAIKASEDFIQKLFELEVRLSEVINTTSSEKEKEKFKVYLNEVRTMRAKTLKIRNELISIRYGYQELPTDEVKGKGIEVAKTLEKQTGEIYNHTKSINSNLTHLYMILDQYRENTDADVSSDKLTVQYLYGDMNFIKSEAEKIYKNFGTIKPPVDVINKSDDAGKTLVASRKSGADFVAMNYTSPGQIYEKAVEIKNQFKSLSYKLMDLHYTLVKLISFPGKEITAQDKEKYKSICGSIQVLLYFIDKSTVPKLEQIEKKYKPAEKV